MCESSEVSILAGLTRGRHIIEPRFDEFKGGAEKKAFLKEMGIPEDIDLSGLRQALGKTPLLSAGGHGPDNFEAGLENGSYDLVAFGRYFMCAYPCQQVFELTSAAQILT